MVEIQKIKNQLDISLFGFCINSFGIYKFLFFDGYEWVVFIQLYKGV